MKYKKFMLLPSFETNTYLLWDEESKEAMLIDPAAPGQNAADYIKNENLELKYIINTHGHGDHIGGNRFFKELFPQAKLAIHRNDAPMLQKADLNLSLYYEQETISPEAEFFLEDGSYLDLGGKQIQIIHTPGHTKGGVSLYVDNLLFSGDTLFFEEVGRTDLPGGSFNELVASIKNKLLVLPDETIVLPGHCENSTIKHEKEANPYV